MALSKGQEQLAQTVNIIQEMLKASEGRAELAEAKRNLEETSVRLQGLEDTFFLQSTLCAYFTRQLLSAAERAQQALAGFLAGEDAERTKLSQALGRLAKAAATLADKSQMRDGVTLT